ncbi:ABC transporter ATP-binding protein [Synechococcus sp. PCC 7336]|uniref:ABC transporter ATP-binding protein n=1 Tax=Synechococcus sp. PCC 7336 TaxID=195250 RepID=UPI00034B4C22|nr:ABC transporter ATP-binding protein [Synechococcus sp. PCC 7336]
MFAIDRLTYHPAAAPEPILREVSLQLPPRQLGAIVGASGAGKSTLLEMLAGLARPTQGEIRWQDKGLAPAQLRKLAGLVFQFPERHFCGFTVVEELRFGHPELQLADVERVLELVGLEELPLERSPLDLSGGQQRRLALAVQLIRSPALLLLDEPTAGLDWSVTRQVVDLLARLKKNWSILAVTHDPESMRGIADVQWRLSDGCLTELAIA